MTREVLGFGGASQELMSDEGIVRREDIFIRDLQASLTQDRKFPESDFIFAWQDSESGDKGPVGELLKLRTSLQGLGSIEHRVLSLSFADYLVSSLESQMRDLEVDSMVGRNHFWREAYIEDLQENIVKINKNRKDMPLLVVPGFAGEGTMDEGWALGMSGRRLYYLSYPEASSSFTGSSELGEWGLENYLDFYEKVLEQLDIERCDAVAWSSGTVFLLGLASKKRTNIRSLVLHNPGGVFDQSPLGAALGLLGEIPWAAGKTGKGLGAGSHISHSHFPPPIDEKERFLIDGKKLKLKTWGKFLEMVSQGFYEEVLESVPAKILIIASENDRVFPPERLNERIKELPNSENIDFMVLKDRGHSGIIADPNLVGPQILRWLDKNSNSEV